MPEHLLLFGREEGFAAQFKSASPGIFITVMCRRELLGRILAAEDCDRVLGLRTDASDDEWLAFAMVIHRVRPVTRIATLGEQDSEKAALIGEALGVHTHSAQTIRWVRNKVEMRGQLRAAGVEDTPGARVRDIEELRQFAFENGYPLVVKPEAGTASLGVSVARGEADLQAGFMRAQSAEIKSATSQVMVERFFEGAQYSVEGFSENGQHAFVAITRKFSEPTLFTEVGHVMPASLTVAEQFAIHDFARRILDALGIRFGPTHTEFVLTPHGPRLIETHVRVGDMFALVPGAIGLDLHELQVLQILGHSVFAQIRSHLEDGARRVRYGAVWYANSYLRGELVKTIGTEDIGEAVEIEVLVEPGEHLTGVESNYSRLAEVRAWADEPQDALDLVRSSVAKLSFIVHGRAAVEPYY